MNTRPRDNADPLCPVCFQPIKPADRVSGRRDDLIHADCDGRKPPPR